MSAVPPVTTATDVTVRTWRVETAVRVFALAIGVGSAASLGTLSEVLPLVAALAVIATASGAVSLRPVHSGSVFYPIAEALLTGILLAAWPGPGGLLAYLVVPPLVAGLRHGWVTTVNTSLVGVAAYGITALAYPATSQGHFAEATPWHLVGLGVGLLAAWQSRTVREALARRAPDAAAHNLVSRLLDLTRRGDVGLDRNAVASELITAIGEATGVARCAVFLTSERGGTELVASRGDVTDLVAPAHDTLPAPERSLSSVVSFTLRGAERDVGSVVLECPEGWSPECRTRTEALAQEFALRLDTADLFERVRLLATAEERNRIARDMHDGVAQEIVALGYLVDEISDLSNEPEVRTTAETLRGELTRVVTELRFSIFDLRHQVADTHLSGALSEYVRQLAQDADFQVNLMLDVSGPTLSQRAETQLLRIAQEAIGNVRKHAHASSVWVTLCTDGSDVLLQIEDDGVGNAAPKERHWGLQTMTERASSLGATLDVSPRPGGGTTVRLARGNPPWALSPTTEGELHEHHSAVGR